MTSQKRYRHHQENSNSSSRHRDLPPRFKRQKSSSSPTPSAPKASPSISPEPHKDSQVDKTTKVTDSPYSAAPDATMPMAPSPQLIVEKPIVGQVRPRADILQTPLLPKMTGGWPWPSTTDGVPVLARMDNLFSSNSPQSPRVNHVSLGTHFGYINRTASPPMSPWSAGGISNFPGQPSTYHSQPWMSAGTDPFRSPQPESPSGFFANNENRMPSQHIVSQFSPSSSAFPSHQQSSPSPPVQNSSVLPAKSSEKSGKSPVTNKNDAKRAIDYSDPDIRTIEMLRELERVADEKESEGDDFGSDRKSLVSHHLRMLMCAVDRYTEGIDDDDMTMSSRGDEVFASSTTDSPASTPVPSPGPSKMWPQDKTTEIAKPKNKSTEPDAGLYCNHSPLWGDAVRQPPVSRHAGFAGVPSQTCSQLMPPSPQASLSWALQEKKPQSPDVPLWDPWSTPYFGDMLPYDIFGNPEDTTLENKRTERKPLYKR